MTSPLSRDEKLLTGACPAAPKYKVRKTHGISAIHTDIIAVQRVFYGKFGATMIMLMSDVIDFVPTRPALVFHVPVASGYEYSALRIRFGWNWETILGFSAINE